MIMTIMVTVARLTTERRRTRGEENGKNGKMETTSQVKFP
jgi:hypothetical protein